MDERAQLLAQWTTLGVAEREALFKAWILVATAGFTPANFLFTAADEVNYVITPDATSWQVAVPGGLFTRPQPSDAVEAGDTVVEIGHLFGELRDIIEELSDFELEDESIDGSAAALLPGIIDALNEERMTEKDPDKIKDIDDFLEEAKKNLGEVSVSD